MSSCRVTKAKAPVSVDGLDAIEEAIVDTPHDVPDALRDPRIEAMGIIGTVIVRGWVVVKMRGVFIESMSVEHVQPGYEAWADAQLATMWLTGRYGWLLDDPRPLATPIACRGAQGLWRVPADVVAQMVRQEQQESGAFV